MDKNRMMELLNEIVNYVQIGKDVPEILWFIGRNI